MISSLVPGFRSHGSPAKQLAVEERAHGHRVRDKHDEAMSRLDVHPAVEEVQDAGPGDVPDAAGEGDPRTRRLYTTGEMVEVESIRSPTYPDDDPGHHHGVPGSVWEST